MKLTNKQKLAHLLSDMLLDHASRSASVCSSHQEVAELLVYLEDSIELLKPLIKQGLFYQRGKKSDGKRFYGHGLKSKGIIGNVEKAFFDNLPKKLRS